MYIAVQGKIRAKGQLAQPCNTLRAASFGTAHREKDNYFIAEARHVPMLRSRRLGSRRHAAAERFDGILESLASFPEIVPEIAFFLQTRKNRFYVQGFGTQAGTQFARS